MLSEPLQSTTKVYIPTSRSIEILNTILSSRNKTETTANLQKIYLDCFSCLSKPNIDRLREMFVQRPHNLVDPIWFGEIFWSEPTNESSAALCIRIEDWTMI